jgi:hypothetical protein
MGDFMLSTIQPSILKTTLTKETQTSGVNRYFSNAVSNNKFTGSDKKEISNLSSFALSMQLSEMNYSESSSAILYRSSDNSLALRANRSVNVNLKTEKIQFDLTLTAESLGLDASAFANKSEPLIIKLQYIQTDLQISSDYLVKYHKTIRTPQEVIQDLVKVLTTAMQDPDKRTIMYTLDEEAIQALVQSDPKLGKLFGELVMIMNAVNLMKEQSQVDHDYVIALTGKGKPYNEISETTDIKGYTQEYSFNITVLPSKRDSPNQAALTVS